MKVILILTFTLALANAIFTGDKKHYCGKSLDKVMKLVCPRNNQKRNDLSSFSHNNDEYILWKNLFNINENTSLSLAEIDFQRELLFERCKDDRKNRKLKNLLKLYKSRGRLEYFDKNKELTIDQFNYPTYEQNSDNYDLEFVNPLIRLRRGIVDECCYSSCPVSALKKYCDD